MIEPAARLRDPVWWAGAAGAVLAVVWLAWLTLLAQIGSLGAPPHAGLSRVDFAAYWGAARLTLAGRAGESYVWPSLAAELQAAFHVSVVRPLPFLYPPPMLLAVGLLGRLPYTAAFQIWTAAGACAYAGVVGAVARRPAAHLAALAPAGVVLCAICGQNGFLTAAALGGGLVLLDRRPTAAGVCFALFACKPHLAVLVPVALIAGARWRALAAMAGAYAVLCATSALVLGPGVFLDFLHGVASGGGSFAGGGWVPWWKVQSVYGALRGLGASAAPALAAQGVCALACAAVVAAVWRSGARTELKAAATAAAVLLTTPYTFVYDGPILGVAIVFLLRSATADARLTAAEGALLAVGLLGQAAFLVVPNSLVTPVTAASLLAVALLRARRSASAITTPRARAQDLRWRMPGRGVGGRLRAGVEG